MSEINTENRNLSLTKIKLETMGFRVAVILAIGVSA